MDDLASEIFQANEQIINAQSQIEQDKIDDVGYYVGDRIRKNPTRFVTYLFTRCRKLNPDLFTDTRYVYHRGAAVPCTPVAICGLAEYPQNINGAQAIWVYKKLLKTLPVDNHTRFGIAPKLYWDAEKHEFVDRESDIMEI